MSTLEVEVLRREAAEEEKEEIERIRKKYKERKKQFQHQKDSNTIDQEKQALIQQAEQQEQQEKEQIRQKYKQRQKQQGQLNTTHHNPEIQALIQQAEQQEQQEKEQIRQKLKERRKERQHTTKPTNNQENKDPHKDVIIEELMENEEIGDGFEDKFDQEADNNNYPLNNHFDDENFDDGIYENSFKSEDVEINDNGENEGLETVDRSAILAKYNIKDVQDADVNSILENFDRPKIDENIEEIEEKIVSNIEKSALSHPKIEWVNVLVFLDDEELEGNIKILAEYDDGSLLNRIISDHNEKLEVELIQIALYEVWDVLTTLGVNIDDLESKIDVEIELTHS
jgi:glutamate synthase domain-containing protein 2